MNFLVVIISASLVKFALSKTSLPRKSSDIIRISISLSSVASSLLWDPNNMIFETSNPVSFRHCCKDLIALMVDRRFKDNLDRVGFEELVKIDGIEAVKASQILAGFELARWYSGKNDVKITITADVLLFVMEIRDKNQEHFVCIYSNGANEVIEKRVVTGGILNANQVYPRELFSDAITERAASIILVHNHPSGNTDPSHEDIAVTKRLVEAGEILGIKIHDHIIVSKNSYTSIDGEGVVAVRSKESEKEHSRIGYMSEGAWAYIL